MSAPDRAPEQPPRRPTASQMFRLTRLRRWLVERRRWNATDAATEFQVSRRTVMDDLECLRSYFGFDVIYDRGINSYTLGEQSGDLADIQLRESELAAMVLAQEILETLGAKNSADAMAEITARARQLMPQLLGTDESDFGPAFSLIRGPSPVEPLPWMVPLEKAIANQQSVQMSYYTLYRNETSERMVDPYHMVSSDGRGYLVGYCHKRSRVLVFRLDRIRSLVTSSKVFLMDRDFNLEDFLGPMFGMFTDRQTFRVKIRFSPFVANWIREEVWHKSQSMHDLTDGSVQVDMEVTGLVAVKKWVMGFGSDAEILEPLHLRREIEYEVDKLSAMYGSRDNRL